MQNIGVCLLVVKSAMKPPDSDLAFVAPVAVGLMTSLPMNAITVVYLIRQRWIRKVSLSL